MYDQIIRVLLVEDDEDDYVITRDLLSEIEGGRFELTWIAGYQEALKAVKNSTHDVCLIDYRLGANNGVELLSHFRAEGYLTPAILLTGMADQNVDRKAMRVGASDYLVKDCINKALLERSIRYAIERNKTLEALRQSENRYRRIVETTSEGIWTLDAQARTSFVNGRMAEMLGYTVEEMLGRSFNDFVEEHRRIENAHQLILGGEETAQQYELQLRHEDGSSRWLSISSSRMFDENCDFIGSLMMLTDISGRKQAEAEHQTFFNHSFDMLAVAGFDGYFKRANPSFERTLGFTCDELMSKPFIEFVHPDDRDRTTAEASKLSSGTASRSFENRYLCKDGSYKHLLWSAAPDAKQQLLYSVAHDITRLKRDQEERAQLNEELAAEKMRLSEIFKQAPSFIATVRGPQHVFEAANPAYYQLVGHRELIGFPVREALPEIEGQGLFELLDKVWETGEPFIGNEWPVKLQPQVNGPIEHRYVNFVYMPLLETEGSISGVLCHGVDVTEQVMARLKLQESEDRYRDLIENSLDLICTYDLEGKILSVNRGAANLLGYEQQDLLQRNMRELLAPEFRREFETYRDLLIREGVAAGEMIVLTSSGERRIWEYRNSLRTEGVEDPVVRGIAHDVTERRKAEQALQQSETKFRALFENALDAVLISGNDGVYMDANPAACKLFQASHDQLVGSSVHAFLEADTEAETTDPWQAFVDGGSRQGIVRMPQPDGKYLDIDYSARANFLPGRHLFVLRDITERQVMEDRFRQAQKMEAIGHLAGGVAHDFNNLLTVINGYADLALRRAENELLQRQLQEIKKAGEHASALTRQLLAFSRKQVLQPKVLNLNEVIRDTHKMLQRMIGEDILMKTSLSEDLGHVKADPGQIEQILMNLVVNARDAMPGGGRIMIKTENIQISEETAQQYVSVRSGPHIKLSVSDTGCGMNSETQKHMFEPFFTTKELGKGTGLGLSTVYGIVKQSDGYISCHTDEGRGTTFNIYLPRVDEGIDTIEASETETIGGNETVLLVEDDESVRQIARTVLEEFGYNVLVASDGPEALRKCEEYKEQIPLMLTDVVMPRMSGNELVEQVQALHPAVKVLYMSGYTDDMIVHHGVLDEDIAFLEKPFTPEALARKVRSVLDAKHHC